MKVISPISDLSVTVSTRLRRRLAVLTVCALNRTVNSVSSRVMHSVLLVSYGLSLTAVVLATVLRSTDMVWNRSVTQGIVVISVTIAMRVVSCRSPLQCEVTKLVTEATPCLRATVMMCWITLLKVMQSRTGLRQTVRHGRFIVVVSLIVLQQAYEA